MQHCGYLTHGYPRSNARFPPEAGRTHRGVFQPWKGLKGTASLLHADLFPAHRHGSADKQAGDHHRGHAQEDAAQAGEQQIAGLLGTG